MFGRHILDADTSCYVTLVLLRLPLLYTYESETQFLSHVRLFSTPWNVACQSPLSMGFSRQEYFSRQSLLSPGDLPYPRIKPGSLALQADSLLFEPLGKPYICIKWQPTPVILPGEFHGQSRLASHIPWGSLYPLHTLAVQVCCHQVVEYISSAAWKTDGLYGVVAKSCVTPCHPIDCSRSSVHGIFQASILEWVAISFSREDTGGFCQGLQILCPLLLRPQVFQALLFKFLLKHLNLSNH